ncbi:hypothetical protein N7504_005141 [Penicillium tannophilum]|nr:hypothetical protein N7504_005141 [Penicillium tannophilum]
MWGRAALDNLDLDVAEGSKVAYADFSPTSRSTEESRITTHEAIVEAGGKGVYLQTDVGVATQKKELVKAAVTTYGRSDI